MAVAALQNDIKEQMQFLNTAYLGDLASPFAGNFGTGASAITFTSAIAFTDLFDDGIVAMNTNARFNADPAQSTVYYSTNTGSTATVANMAAAAGATPPADTLFWSTLKTNANITFINTLPLMATTNNNVTVNGATPTLQNFAAALNVWHAILDVKKWKSFTSNVATTIEIPTTDTVSQANVSLTATLDSNNTITLVDTANPVRIAGATLTAIQTVVNGIFNIADIKANNADSYVLRRLVYLYIQLLHYQVARSFYQQKFTDTTNNPHARSLVEAIYLLMAKANYFVENADGTQVQINKKLMQRQKKYYNNVDNANKLTQDLDDSRSYYKDRSSSLSRTRVTEKQVAAFNWTTTAVAAAIAIVAVVIVLYPMDHHKKMLLSMALIASAFVVAIIMFVSFNKVVTETFSNAKYGYIGEANAELTNELSGIHEAMLQQVSDYLSNTQIIQTTFTSFKAYGNINSSLQRELNFFNATKENVDNQSMKTKQVSNIITQSYIEQTYRMYLMVSLSIIISLTVAGYIAADGKEGVQKNILIVGGVLAIIAFIFYVFEVNARVHTDVKKMYWGNPGDPESYSR